MIFGSLCALCAAAVLGAGLGAFVHPGVAASSVEPPPSGCPAGPGPDQVAAVTLPAQLVLDGQQSTPALVERGTDLLTLRYHVSDTCGHSVQGALVYVTAVPFNQFSIPSEQTTGADGWASLSMVRLGGFPASPRQQLLALFVRARKPGEPLTAGIAARRLFSVSVSLGPAIFLTVTPSTVHRGQLVRIGGSAGDCPVGDTVFIISPAFPATHEFAGVPAVLAKVRTGGRFHATTRIPLHVRVGGYLVTARCGGGNLGVSAQLTVLR